MASKETVTRTALTLPTSATTPNDKSQVLYVGDLDPATVSLSASGSATSTFKYEVSIDKANWFQCGADLVETGAFADMTALTTAGSNPRATAVWARLRCSAFTSIASAAFTVAGQAKSL